MLHIQSGCNVDECHWQILIEFSFIKQSSDKKSPFHTSNSEDLMHMNV